MQSLILSNFATLFLHLEFLRHGNIDLQSLWSTEVVILEGLFINIFIIYVIIYNYIYYTIYIRTHLHMERLWLSIWMDNSTLLLVFFLFIATFFPPILLNLFFLNYYLISLGTRKTKWDHSLLAHLSFFGYDQCNQTY